MNKILSENRFKKIMEESAVKATADFAKEYDLPVSLELLLVMYSGFLTCVIHDRLFEEVKK